jgi:hypothetical protein
LVKGKNHEIVQVSGTWKSAWHHSTRLVTSFGSI